VLVAYASVLENLLLDAPRLDLAPDLRQIVSNSETLSARSRTQLHEAFGVPILDNYSCGECAIVSTGCATDPGAHVNADWVMPEVVDEHYRPVPPGETGHKVLLTHLANTVQPFIRYELNDRIVMATTPCHCGNRLPRIERIEGRTADFFLVRVDGKDRQLVGTLFKNAFDFLRDVREWQAIQVEKNRIQILVEMLPGKSLDMARCRQMLDHQLDLMGVRHAVQLEVRVVPNLRPDPITGKFRRCISLEDGSVGWQAPPAAELAETGAI
jgi:phenylacetate-coenzyme A ligase PaaK-like adenylate-forming protein